MAATERGEHTQVHRNVFMAFRARSVAVSVDSLSTNFAPTLKNQMKGLLCDLDGTLADSEPLHCNAWLELLREEYGLDYDEHWFEQWIGTSDVTVAEHLVVTHRLDLSWQELSAAKRARFHAAVPTQGRSFPGVPAQLERIGERFPLAIATNSGREDADLMIRSLGLDRYTAISVTASDVEHRKPAPDIYLLAAKQLGLVAEHCIAIEDSGPGGNSARAAGCYLIGLNEKVKQADEYIADNALALERAFELLKEGK